MLFQFTGQDMMSLCLYLQGACGIVSSAMCAAYMITGMSGLEWHALPDNPGAVYKSNDIVYKHYVWSKWGYSQNSMRV